MRHEVAVAVRRKAAIEALEVGVRGGQVEHLHLRESGEVDAQENPLTNIYNFDLHKTHRVITLTGHLLGVALVLFNRQTVEGWPPDVRAAVEAAVAEATIAQRRFAEDDDTICAKALRDDGVTLVELTQAERAAFETAARVEVEKTRSRFDAELIALFEDDIARVRP